MTPAGFNESFDRRVLGGFVFLDAITSASIAEPLAVTSTPLRVRMNRSGIYAIFDAPNFTALTSQLTPVAANWPPAVQAQNFEITVQDPSQRYLSRRADVQIPQPLATLGTPPAVTLYPSPSAAVSPNWAVVRASVTGTSGAGLPYALVRVLNSDNSVAATGMTDARGEALLAVPGLGVQVSTTTTGSVTETAIAVTVQAWVDPTLLNPPAGWVPNPDLVVARIQSGSLKTGTMAGSLGVAQVLLAAITISV